jgi:hypothetical protein
MFPEVESSRRFPGIRSQFANPVRRILNAGRSLIDPPGLNHSAFAKTLTAAGKHAVTRRNGNMGVFPTLYSRPRGAGGATTSDLAKVTCVLVVWSDIRHSPSDYMYALILRLKKRSTRKME